MSKKRLVVGTRSSQLALWQADFVIGELEKRYPDLEIEKRLMTTKGDKILNAPLTKIDGKGLFTKERENAITREHGTVLLMQIGGKLKSGKPHDGRAPDYDDWELNGDILFYDDTLGAALEISSMGIRVDEKSLAAQLKERGCEERAKLPFHSMLLRGELPLTIGGGIGQSRLCMLMMGCAHIGEVQSSIWDKATREGCRTAGIILL